MLADEPIHNLIEEIYRNLSHAVGTAITKDVPPELTYALEHNTFIFSGWKVYHEMEESRLLLTGDDGGVKPWTQFLQEVQGIDNTYNKEWLRAEYQYAVHSSQMAVKWQDVAQDGDRYDLQYRTAGDDHVREEHQALHNITLPESDPFWDSYYPPNGWGCRCTVVQVRIGKYDRSDSDDAIRRGNAAQAPVLPQGVRKL